MTIYKGNILQKELSKNNIVFAEVYKGSQKVYSKNNGISLFCGTNTIMNINFTCYVIGNYTINNPLFVNAYITTLNQISGILGSAGSSITIRLNNTNYTLSYVSSIIVNNVLLYYYRVKETSAYLVSYRKAFVQKNSVIGSTIIGAAGEGSSEILYPYSLTETKIILDNSGAFYNRDSSQDKIWTINGVY